MVSCTIAHLAEMFQESDELTTRLMDALSQSHNRPFNTTAESTSCRRDVSVAARWMAQNYHNPYPSNAVRDRISQQANWNRKDVDGWFTEARKRMGWNSIRKRFCGNKRAEVVQQASEFFKRCGSLSNPALESAFAQMLARVQELFVGPHKSQIALAQDFTSKDRAAPALQQGVNRCSL
jgi:hypothetical protein